jgi:cAMP-dependent protein kinase regulator
MYFVEQGEVSIKILQNGEEVEISKLERGQYFGELALVTQKPRAASAYAIGTVKVACKLLSIYDQKTRLKTPFSFIVLDVDAFERLLGSCLEIMKRNIDNYESQLIKIFGSKQNIADIR